MQHQLSILNSEIKFRSRDLSQRKNEVLRKQRVYRMKQEQQGEEKGEQQVNRSRRDLVTTWSCRQVHTFIKDEMHLPSCAKTLLEMDMDGAMLLECTDRDLRELGISIRLHRIKILKHLKSFLFPTETSAVQTFCLGEKRRENQYALVRIQLFNNPMPRLVISTTTLTPMKNCIKEQWLSPDTLLFSQLIFSSQQQHIDAPSVLNSITSNHDY